MLLRNLVFSLNCLVLLIACGGGGGSSDDAAQTPPVNPVPVTLTLSGGSVAEGDSGSSILSFRVTLSAPASAPVTVDYATSDDLAQAGSDYTAEIGTLTIAAGATTAEVAVSVTGDTEVESDENLSLALSAPSSNVTLGNTIATGTILDDDTSSALIMVQIADASITEGDSGTAILEFAATLDQVTADAVTFDFATADDTALAPSDYVSQNGTALISAGSDSTLITIEVVGDTEVESTENFTLLLTNVSSNAELANTEALGRIVDNDGTPAAGFFLNDTGVRTCSNQLNSGLRCNDMTDGTDRFPRQDAEAGRDVTAADDSDGLAGFSFSKLDASGSPIADQTTSYSADPWDCVYDNTTGSYWEIKTNAADLRDRDWRYGFVEDALCPAGSGSCSISEYITAVNDAGLCGFSDWRLPTSAELVSVVNYGSVGAVVVDESYFPNTAPVSYLTSTIGNFTLVLAVEFYSGTTINSNGNSAAAIRLTRRGR